MTAPSNQTHAADLIAQYESAVQRLQAAEEEVQKLRAQHRATEIGLAESMRAIELAEPSDRRNLLALHAQAERDSFDEFTVRHARWAAELGSVRGAVKALPCGANPPLTRLLLQHRVLGYYRYQPDSPTRKVTAVREVGSGKYVRRTFTTDTPIDTLADAITVFATHHRRRLDALLGDPQLADQFAAAVIPPPCRTEPDAPE